MIVIHVCRKPVEGTVAKNALKYGTGGLDVGSSRIGVGLVPSRVRGSSLIGTFDGAEGNVTPDRIGRWPSNVIFRHQDTCRQVGTREVNSNGHYPRSRPRGSQVSGPSGHQGQEDLEERHTAGEEVPVWECAEDCPVRALDEKVGDRPTSKPGTTAYVPKFSGDVFNASKTPQKEWGYGDKGGASRFFKQVGGEPG